MSKPLTARFVMRLTLTNCAYQLVFIAAWWVWLRHLVMDRWGATATFLVQAGVSLLPTVIVFAIVMRFTKQIGLR